MKKKYFQNAIIAVILPIIYTVTMFFTYEVLFLEPYRYTDTQYMLAEYMAYTLCPVGVVSEGVAIALCAKLYKNEKGNGWTIIIMIIAIILLMIFGMLTLQALEYTIF